VKSLRVLERAAGKLAPGRPPHFIEAHLVRALRIIGSEGPVGRARLAKALGLGEGAVRTLLKHLENQGIIEASRAGIILTGSGKRLSSDLGCRISTVVEVPHSSLTVGAFNMALLSRNAANSVKAGIEQRDAAIKVGAQGATTLVFSQGKLVMPSVEEDVLKTAPNVRETLMSRLKPEENDVIVIGSADDKLTAEYGAIAAALETLKAQRVRI